MRQTTVLRRLRVVTRMYVEGLHLGRSGSLTVSARPSWRWSRCGVCGRRALRYDRQAVRLWRHVPGVRCRCGFGMRRRGCRGDAAGFGWRR